MPAYNDTPLATQQINQTQAPIRTNFQSLESLIDINHVDFSDPLNFGKHTVVSLLQAAASPPLTGVPPANAFTVSATGGDVGFYNFINPTTGFNEIYVNKINAGPTAVQIPMTASKFNQNFVGAGYTYTYSWSYLPSGMLMLMGKLSVFTPPASTFPATIFYPVAPAFPGFTAGTVPYVQITQTETPAVVSPFDHVFVVQDVAVPTHLSFKLNCHNNPSATVSCFFLAMGN